MSTATKQHLAAVPKRKYESQRQLARRAAILSATREMLAEVGYAATTMRGLADKAQVAPGTLYNLFSSKDELLLAAVEDLLEDIIKQGYANAQAGLERIILLARMRAQVIVENPKYAEAITLALFRGDQDDSLKSLLYLRGLPLVQKDVEAAIAAGDLVSDCDGENLARHLLTQSWGIVMAWFMDIFPLEGLSDEYVKSQVMVLTPYATDQGLQHMRSLGA